MLEKHPYIPNDSSVLSEMLQAIGISNLSEMFLDVPISNFGSEGLQRQPLDEYSMVGQMKSLLSRNKNYGNRSFIGGGPWTHFVPGVIRHIISRGEFLTAYTPYQPEISQGLLQSLFEFQSLICELYGMGVANASMYDLPTAIGEAALLCARVTGRQTFLVPSSIPWEKKSVLRNYIEPQGMAVREVPYDAQSGNMDLARLREAVDEGVSGVYLETPSFFGTIEPDLTSVADVAHHAGSLFVVGADPISMGSFRAPGEGGADIAVGDGQPLGIPPGFGGNGLGLMACVDEPKLVRQLPGRIVGLTKTKDGTRDGFVLALSTREQHIRRGRATSNICTNESLLAIAATVYLALLGQEGLTKLSRVILNRTAYAVERLQALGLAVRFSGMHFRDFVVEVSDPGGVNSDLRRLGFSGGRELGTDFQELDRGLLFATTEIHTYDDIDNFAEALQKAAGGRK
ncbi:MAG: aminomethyl-transferring glycine dehydrogenase subunit GcvPA [Candidatus Methanomethylicus sp.]|nr:aminomethyl-transferring glycine dehydrogenase subunit GcvPA [Candidatus Methanomethylicus sp.]